MPKKFNPYNPAPFGSCPTLRFRNFAISESPVKLSIQRHEHSKPIYLMKRNTPFLSLLPSINSFSNQVISMYTSTTISWLVRALMWSALAIVTTKATAQCSLSYKLGNTPPTLVFQLGNPSGTTTLNAAAALPYFQTACPNLEFSQTPNDGNSWVASTVFNCTNITSAPQAWFARANGPSGPSAPLSFSVVVRDVTNPQITCPTPAQSYNTASNACVSSAILFAPTVTDNSSCTTVNQVISGATIQNGGSGPVAFNPGISVVTFTVADAGDGATGNTATCSFTVNVVDDVAPTINCPQTPAPVNADLNTCAAVINSGLMPTVNDNCNPLLAYMLSGATIAGTTAGNANGATFNKGITTVTYTATDPSGNTATCSVNVEVKDGQGPTLTDVPANLTVGTSTGSNTVGNLCDGFATWTHPTASDNCQGAVTLEMAIGGGSFVAVTPGTSFAGDFFSGTTIITYLATDDAGVSSTATFSISVIDNEAPILDLMGIITLDSVAEMACQKTLTINRPSSLNASDCGSVTIQQLPAIVNGQVDNNFFNGTTFNATGANTPLTNKIFKIGKTQLTYVWTDGAGNTAQHTITIIVYDGNLQATAAKCKTNTVSVTLDSLGQATITPALVDNGSGDNCDIITFSSTLTVSPNTVNCSQLDALQTVVLTLTTVAGLSDTCQAHIDVVDNMAPRVKCPTVPQTSVDIGKCTKNFNNLNFTAETTLANLGAREYYDNSIAGACQNTVTANYSTSGAIVTTGPAANLNGVPFPIGTTTVTVTVTDESALTASCSFQVVIKDLNGPVITNAGANPMTQAPVANSTIEVNANTGGCLAQVFWVTPIFKDTCNGVLFVTNSHSPGSTFPFGNTTVSYIAVDGANNVTTHSFTVRVVDSQAPNAKCKNTAVNLNANGMGIVNASEIDNSSTDNCFFQYNPATYTFDCSNLGQNVVTLTLQDGSGLTSTCTATVTVNDATPPQAACAAASTVDLDASGSLNLQASLINNGSADNCGSGSLTYAIRIGNGNFAPSVALNCSHLGNQVVTLRVSDASGNSSTCTRSITVRDVTPPTFTLPGSQVINCSASVLPANTGNPTQVADACDANVAISYSDLVTLGDCPNEFVIARIWKATDASGNSSTSVQNISIVDNIAPSFMMDDTIMLNTPSAGVCTAAYSASLSANQLFDNCGGGLISFDIRYQVIYPVGSGLMDISIPQSGSLVPNSQFPIGNTKVTWFVTDACGNSNSFTVNIVVRDAQGPVFANYPRCGTTVNLNNISGSCNSLFQWDRPTDPGDITDCTAISVTENISNSTVQGLINVINPFVYNGAPSTVFAQFPVGNTTVTYTATDAYSNVTVCSFQIQIADTEQPTLGCPGSQILASTCSTAVVPNYLTNVQVTDNCPANVTLSQSPAGGVSLSSIPGLVVETGATFTVTVTANDPNPANTKTCTFDVTLQDGEAPVPVTSSLPTVVGFCGMDTVFAPLAIDPCNQIDSIWGTPSASVAVQVPNMSPPAYILNVGNYVITWTYDDGNGNVSSQQQFITLLPDNFPPVAACDDPFFVNLDTTGTATIDIDMIDDDSNDPNACGPITRSINKNTFNCNNIGANVVTLLVTDNAGLTATCTTTVTVRDVQPPKITASPANITVQACGQIPPPVTLTATDKCDANVPVVFNETSTQAPAGLGKYNYELTRTWTATDDSNNSASVVQIISIQDTLAPEFSLNAPDTIILLTGPDRMTCDDTATVNIVPFVSDCSTGADLQITNLFNLAQGGVVKGLFGLGVYTITFKATDAAGNFSTHNVVLIVKDGTAPTAACTFTITVSLQPSGNVVISTDQVDANSFDNCTDNDDLVKLIQRLDIPNSIPAATVSFNCADADNVTANPVRMTVVDEAGNAASCESQIYIQDNVSPSITLCPPSKSVDCNANLSPQVQGFAQASDNCQANLTFTYADTLMAGNTPASCQVLRRTWKTTDLALNMATCVQTLTIVDQTAPVFSTTPASVTISCDQPLPPVPSVGATDNCSGNVVVNLMVDTIDVGQGVCGKYEYTVRRAWTATDACGNTATQEQLIVIRDNVAPAFPNLPDTLVFLSSIFPFNGNCTVPVGLNFGIYVEDCALLDEITITNDAPFGNQTTTINGNYTVGDYWIHVEAQDACGNIGIDSILIQVFDNSIPTAICTDALVISLGSGGVGTLTPQQINNGSFDNCSIDTLVLSKTEFDCSDIGVQNVIMTVTDIYGNTNTCSVNVNVTPGPGMVGIMVSAQGTPESSFGADNGTAQVLASGGSGSYNYQWSNNASTPTISNLQAGIYSVTVTDNQTGCQGIDTAIVAEGAKLNILAGQASGAQGQIVLVPITVQNYFEIYSFAFTLNLSNAAVGSFLGIQDPNPAIGQVQSNLFTATELGIIGLPPANTLPVTLANNAVLFNVRIQLSNATVGTTSPVLFTSSPLLLSVQQDSLGFSVNIPMLNTSPGSVTINSTMSSNFDLAGDIRTWKNPEIPTSIEKPVPGAVISLSGTVTNSFTTTAAGTYTFSVPATSNTLATVSKSTPNNTGVTSIDLLRIQNHIFGNAMPSPYQWVAADVNNDNMVSLSDYLPIQRLVLGITTGYAQSPDWKFVPKSYVFPTPNPLSAPEPTSISHTNVNGSFLDDDFVAIRMGDVNGSINPSFQNDDADDRYDDDNALIFKIENTSIKAGENVIVPVRASDFIQRQAYQYTVSFEKETLELIDVQPGRLDGLTLENFGMAHLDEGHLTTVWVNRNPVTVVDGEVLYTLTFRAVKKASLLSQVLHIGSAVTHAEALSPEGLMQKVDFEFSLPGEESGAETFALYQNQPNPAAGIATIGFRLPKAGEATLRIYNSAGQLVWTGANYYEKGYQQERIQTRSLGTPGVYWYELETEGFRDRKKMITID